MRCYNVYRYFHSLLKKLTNNKILICILVTATGYVFCVTYAHILHYMFYKRNRDININFFLCLIPEQVDQYHKTKHQYAARLVCGFSIPVGVPQVISEYVTPLTLEIPVSFAGVSLKCVITLDVRLLPPSNI